MRVGISILLMSKQHNSRRKSGDRYPTQIVRHTVHLMGSREMTTAEILEGLLNRTKQAPTTNQLSNVLARCGLFDKAGTTYAMGFNKKSKVTVWRVRKEAAIDRGFWIEDESE